MDSEDASGEGEELGGELHLRGWWRLSGERIKVVWFGDC